MAVDRQQQHFIFVSYPAQGHINPSLNLAKRLSAMTGARITFCTSISAHRLMFPSLSSPDEEVKDSGGMLTYFPFSDGYDGGCTDPAEYNDFMLQLKLQGSRNLSKIISSLADRGRPVTGVVYTLFVPWAADVAREHNIPSIASWIQPATVFAIYHHYFHGYESYIRDHADDPSFLVELPGLPKIQLRDLPSFCTVADDDPFVAIFFAFKEAHLALAKQDDNGTRPKLLVNTFEALESEAISSTNKVEIVPVGPMLPPAFLEGKEKYSGSTETDLIKTGEEKYMEWLNSQADNSVVYVSFGSYAMLKKEQLEEIAKALEESERPYLWVLRKNNRSEVKVEEMAKKGLVVEWCSQMKVLSHGAVGCFVTHCGWNSMIESITCGTPTVCAPIWTDQITNSRLAESFWGTGVKAEANSGGVVEAAELQRCMDVVMGEDERGREIRRKAKMWGEEAMAAVKEGGSSYHNLMRFVDENI